MQSLQGFKNFSGIGLHDGLTIEKVIEEPLRIPSQGADGFSPSVVRPELTFSLRNNTTTTVSLDAVDPSQKGVASKPILTLGDLRQAITGQTAGKVTVDYSFDGRSLVLNDSTTGTGALSVAAANGFDQLALFGLDVDNDSDPGVLKGEPIYQPSVLDALRRLLDLLRSYEDLDALNQPIPGTTTSIKDLLEFADKLETAIDELQNNPVESLQKLELALESSLKINAGDLELAFEGNAIKIVFRWANSETRTLGLNFDLGGTLGPLVDAKGKAGVTATAGAAFTLALGIDISNPTNLRPFLYTNDTGTELLKQGTKFDITAKVSTPQPINMSVNVGPLGVSIQGGKVALDVDGAGPLTTPAI